MTDAAVAAPDRSLTGWYRESTPKVRRVFWTCAAAWGLDSMDGFVYQYMIPAVRLGLGLTLAQAGTFTGQDLKALIAAAGVERTILGSDLGQINNPRPVASFRSVILLLLGLGYSKTDIRKLISLNACSVMGIAPPPSVGESA